MKKNNVKIAVISLGCDKNRVDTETILYRLIKSGYQITDDNSRADIIIINTCAFIASAQKEAVETIFECNKARSNSLKKLIVTGCLPQRYGEKLVKLLPEVDCFIGINDYDDICGIIESDKKIFISGHKRNDTSDRIISTPPHYSYLKIAEGCDNHCTYCTIPSLRGPYRSGDIDKLVHEAKSLEDRGVTELIIVAQDTTRYGIDLYGELKLTGLLKNILINTDFVRIRLLYCYPELVNDQLIELIESSPRIYDYLDIPLQHISNSVLKRMGRKSTKEHIIRLFEKLSRAKIRVRTTFMVGFPGETEEDFKELCDFVALYKPYHVGIFAYSKEEGTPSSKMKEQLPKSVKSKRVQILGDLHKTNTEYRNKMLIGKILSVVYEDIDYDRGLFMGRTEYDAPEIDGFVYFKGNNAEVGRTYSIKITGYDGYDLIGEQI